MSEGPLYPISRRSFLVGTIALGSCNITDASRKLVMGVTNVRLDKRIPLWLFNGTLPGKPLTLRRGHETTIHIKNDLPEPTSVHWHGLRVPFKSDGVAGVTQAPLMPGLDQHVRLRPSDAGTFWYHPHMNSLRQIGSGLAGALVVEEERAPSVEHDETLVIQEFFVRNRDNRLAIEEVYGADQRDADGGMRYILTVNGKISSKMTVISGERIRLRMLNAGPFSSFDFSLPGVRAWIMAFDGMPVATPLPLPEKMPLAPGQRIDLLIDADISANLLLRADTALVSGASPWRLDVKGARRSITRSTPAALEYNDVALPDLPSAIPLTLRLGRAFPSAEDERVYNEGLNEGVDFGWRKPWSLNGQATRETFGGCGDSVPLFALKHRQSYIMEIINPTDEPHPIHLHGYSFHLLSENDQELSKPIIRDTVYVKAGSRATIAFVADNIGSWMIHCHTAGHQITGMMGLMQVG
jgi:FtsP/CotA-like multicopper oxidase with cupredoxin domain